MSAAPRAPQHHGTLRDWMDLHPRPIGLLRLMVTLGILFALSIIGTILGSMQIASATGPNGCTYQAEEVNPPVRAQTAAAGSVFPIVWDIQNTGTCQTWSRGVGLSRVSDQIPSEQKLVTFSGESNVGAIIRFTTVMTAPDQPGVYETAWQMRAPNETDFGLVMTRRVQVYPADQPAPTNPPLNHDRIDYGLIFRFFMSLVLYPLPAAVAILLVLWRGADFLQNVYQLKSPPTSHIFGMMFGGNAGHVRVRGTKLEADQGVAGAAVEMIGGPVWVTVPDRTAILTERGAKFSRVLGSGVHLLRAHERVRGIVDLQIQRRRVKHKTLTKDGIPLELDVDLTFRVTDHDIEGEAPPPPPPPIGPRARLRMLLGLHVSPTLLEASKPHRFSREAVRRIVYETPIAAPDVPPDWTQSFAAIRTGEVAKEFSDRRLDDLSSPEDPDVHPLRQIVDKALADVREDSEPAGIDVLTMEMGIVEPPEDIKEHVNEQRIGNWMIEWKRRAKILEAEGDAIAAQAKEEARAEAQATMIQALTEGFRIATAGDTKVSTDVIAMRFIDALEALMQTRRTADEQSSDEGSPNPEAIALLIARQERKE